MTEDHHVRFASGTHLEPECIHLSESSDPNLPPEAHLGILRTHHTYSANIPIPHSLGAVVSGRHAQSNIYITVTGPPETVEFNTGNGKYISTLTVKVKTIKEGNIRERIEIFVEDEEQSNNGLEVILTAKVLKTSQGNPVLKEGVRLLSHEHTDESDFTEWPGFTQDKNEEVED